ncbi:hypothetical protein BKK79_06720 [Cupriavidus sp. USMAA2-4]|uniref:hypothetical protein n=1 Tax=Cupriavidus sp. USMAA2-4 TaxID=876364 RepID=UPI0008A6ED88|nr:hypothetical protein [Cupriavidus sp. USMAA2-4]AOY91542.1 hypothetical protein BKK79_06720 [Cupriavidus sp. USMAA2-4]
MSETTHGNITVSHSGSAVCVTTWYALETPREVAADKAAQLHSLLFFLRDYAASNPQFGELLPAMHEGILSVAEGLALEARLLSELAAVAADDNASASL